MSTKSMRRALRTAAKAARKEAARGRMDALRALKKATRSLIAENVRRAHAGKPFVTVGSTAAGKRAEELKRKADQLDKHASEIARLAGSSGGKKKRK